MKQKLTKEELSKLTEMNTEFNMLKAQLGDIAISKHRLLKKVSDLEVRYIEHEKELLGKYGSDSVINMQTGVVTQKGGTNGDKKA